MVFVILAEKGKDIGFCSCRFLPFLYGRNLHKRNQVLFPCHVVQSATLVMRVEIFIENYTP